MIFDEKMLKLFLILVVHTIIYCSFLLFLIQVKFQQIEKCTTIKLNYIRLFV
jgi:hypothetical protein